MKAIEKLNVTADEFFKEITDSIIGDIKKTTNKSIHASQIKPGLNYKKVLPNRFKGNSEVTVKVLSCIPLKEYSSVFESDVDRTYVIYRIENILEDGIEASYEESYETKKEMVRFVRKMDCLDRNIWINKVLKRVKNY